MKIELVSFRSSSSSSSSFATHRESSTYLESGIVGTLSNDLVSSTIGLGNELVQLAVCVVSGQPQGLTVSRVLATTVVLLLSCIDNRNTVSHDSKCSCVLGEGNVVGAAGFPRLARSHTERNLPPLLPWDIYLLSKTWVIVVLQEVSKKG